MTWVENGIQKIKKISTNILITIEDWEDWKNQRTMRVEAHEVRDRLRAVLDFGQRLDLPEQTENVAAMRAFLENPNPIKEVPLERIRDFIKQFIKLNEKNYSKSRINHYRTLLRNVDLYIEQSKTHDLFSAMSREAQMSWFSGFRDFLLYTEIDGIKVKYENISAVHSMNMFKNVCSVFMETGVKISPMQFVKGLRIVKPDAIYLTKSELQNVIDSWPSATPLQWKAIGLFLFQCVTGLRYGELKFKEGAIHNNILTITSGKKGIINQIPLGNLACRILNEWKNKKIIYNFKNDLALPVINQTNANVGLHEFLAKIPAFNRTIQRVRYRGNERIEETMPLHLAVTTHTGRHTFSYLMTSGGLGIDEVGSLLSHGSIETTNKHYKHLEREHIQKKALEIINAI